MPLLTTTTTPPNRTGAWSKLRLLMWKNWLLQKRHYIQTIVDILLPVFIFVLLALIQKIRMPDGHSRAREYPSLNITGLNHLWDDSEVFPSIKDHALAYYPNNTVFGELMKIVSESLELQRPVAVNHDSQLESVFLKNEMVAAIQFHHSPETNVLPKNLSYAIRLPSQMRAAYTSDDNWHTKEIFTSDNFNLQWNVESPYDGPPSYYKEGFLAIQNAVARAYLNASNSTNQMPDIAVNRFPFPQFTYNVHWTILQMIVPLFVLFGFNYSFSNAVRFIAIEKERQLKEAMKIMGLPSWLHWLSWFLRSTTMLSISLIVIIILLKVPCFNAPVAVLPNSNAFLLILFFVAYAFNLTTFSFLVSTFFSSAKASITAASILWYLTYIPYLATNGSYDQVAGWLKLLLCIFPNTAMAYGIKLILLFEEMGEGLIWSTMWQSKSVYDSLTVGTTMLFLLFSSMLFLVLTMYIESIFPGTYGVAKPWYFPFRKDFWCRSHKRKDYQAFDDHNLRGDDNSDVVVDPGHFEVEPTDQYAGVVIKNLSKTYGKTAVVSNLSMNMFNNQISVLLGHNGAGKTTTFSMLTGMIEPTSGTAWINGHDIRSNMDQARSSMGFCPQHNILFDELTVGEHIVFYSRLKGMSETEANEECEKYVRLLELEPKKNEMASKLSGGMKRKLSIGIALCGRSKVVFCDEPTSGIDAASRRSLWNVLVEEKKDRVIVLTTHFMDEADVLGDRIAIMSHGGLQCFGSSFFLKKRFGTGYHLICEKKDHECHTDHVTGLLRKYLPSLQVDTENESEVTYLLPEDQVHLFKDMFRDLEQNEQKLNLNSYGVSLTTMEEIFLKFGKEAQQSDKISENGKSGSRGQPSSEVISIAENHFNETVLLTGTALLRNQCMAMLKKRFLCWLRSWKIFIYYNVIIFIIMAPTIFQGYSFSFGGDGGSTQPLDISLAPYKKPIAVVQDVTHSDSQSEIIKQYQQNLWSHSQKTEVLTTANDDMNTFLLSMANQSLSTFHYQYIAAVSMLQNGTIVAWFNNFLYHTAPLALNLVHNAVVRTFINPTHSIHVTNAPFDYIEDSNSTSHRDSPVSLFGFSLVVTMGIALPIVSASYIMFYVHEKTSRAKFLQYASGINLGIFWIVSILWDVFTNFVTVGLIVCMLAFSRQAFWTDAKTLGVVGLIITVYNFAMMPVIGLLSLIFTKPTTGVNVTYFSSLLIAMVFAADNAIDFLNKIVRWLLVMFPPCTLVRSFVKLGSIDVTVSKCDRICAETNCNREMLCEISPSCCENLLFTWNENSVSKDLLLMLATCIIATTLLLCIEKGVFRRLVTALLRKRQANLPAAEVQLLDDDVSEMKQRVDAMTVTELREQNLVLQNVSKFYGNFVAVNKVSLEIKQAECFGLLGNNGAGKTSVFKMLTGEVHISSGEIFLQGIDLKSDMGKVYKCIGYCPQFDALLESLTAREILEIFALIRGVQWNECNGYALRAATDLDFIEHINKRVSQMSGGNKRKLSTALALTGNPKVIFLDEPTTGMDPATKRNLWNIIIKLRDQGKSIVLTSHSMEECEALCTHLTIMVNGNCKCYGSSQHLKNKFTRGFELKIKIKQDAEEQRSTSVKEFVTNAFQDATLTDEHHDLLTYSIPARNLKWSSIFEMMENGKESGNIDDYSVSQHSLEHVLLSFVKNQRARNNKGDNGNVE